MELGLRSEASSRHEKSCRSRSDRHRRRARRATAGRSSAATRTRRTSSATRSADARPILLRGDDVTRAARARISRSNASRSICELLGCERRDATARRLPSRRPSWRRDLTIAADLVEEVARMEGYDTIEAGRTGGSRRTRSRAAQYRSRKRGWPHTLAALGYHEIITYSLTGARIFERSDARPASRRATASVEVRNPLSEDQRFLRWALGPGLLRILRAHRRAVSALFEIGHVFSRRRGHITESAALTFGFTVEPIDEPAWRDTNFLASQGRCEALLRDDCRDRRRGRARRA